MPMPLTVNRRRGINGFLARRPSKKTKPTARTPQDTPSVIVRGWSQGSLSPPKFKRSRKLVVMAPKTATPTKSTSRRPDRGLEVPVEDGPHLAPFEEPDGSSHMPRKQQAREMGA